MPDSLITVFDRIRAAQEPAVPGTPDLGDVQGRARRVRRRRRFAAVAAAACCLVVVAGVVAQVRPGGDEREVVPAGPPAGSGSTGPLTSRSLLHGTPPQRTANVAATGFLTPEDLRHDDPVVTWQVDEAMPGSDVDTLALPRCLTGTGTLPTPSPGNSHYLVDGTGADRTYTAVVPEGRLVARETVLRLDTRNEALAADYLRRIVGCSRFEGDGTVLQATGSLLVMGVARPGTGTLTDASVVLLTLGRLISIDVNGTPAGTFAIPGGEQWLAATASKAAERAGERGE